LTDCNYIAIAGEIVPKQMMVNFNIVRYDLF
jgi:hypothetical protein